MNVDSSPRLSRRSFVAPDETVRFRNSFVEVADSPRLSKKFYESEASPMIYRRSVESRVSHEDLYIPLYKAPEFPPHRSDPHKYADQQIITERFSSYCIEPPTDEVFRRDSPALKRGELVRAASVKSGGRRGDPCVGMDSLEINWSVRQLKTLFQDARAPAINTDYTIS
ncbi:unnamed protein product [Nippostrongylus brasiliensis]|uniref:Uncharacterized protein n=1 Tax=Nippostrongylus brasiliensis TaxID=27835 RepID=A0A0N4YBK3_NIPBR|nr:unnamed protein product [Nippostrongylus brasiliensis]